MTDLLSKLRYDGDPVETCRRLVKVFQSKLCIVDELLSDKQGTINITPLDLLKVTELLKEGVIDDMVDVFSKDPKQWMATAELFKSAKDSGRASLLCVH